MQLDLDRTDPAKGRVWYIEDLLNDWFPPVIF